MPMQLHTRKKLVKYKCMKHYEQDLTNVIRAKEVKQNTTSFI